MLYHLSYSHHDPPTRTPGRREVYPSPGALLEPARSGLRHCLPRSEPSDDGVGETLRRTLGVREEQRRLGELDLEHDGVAVVVGDQVDAGVEQGSVTAGARVGRAATTRSARSRSASLASRAVMISCRYSSSPAFSR